LINAYGLDVVQAYMHHIQANAEVAVRDMLREIGTKVLQHSGGNELEAEDYLDDGSPIRLKISIDVHQGAAVCDFRCSLLVCSGQFICSVFPANHKFKLCLCVSTVPWWCIGDMEEKFHSFIPCQ
jgi:N-methylhydantoinase B/oxoprolinase/acetone carboxylase alpha subunit